LDGFTGSNEFMDVYRIIRELVLERDRLQRIIESLEEMRPNGGAQERPERKRRGRKSMDLAAREEVSERMKRYWAQRKAKARGAPAKGQDTEARGSGA
jgi:hypothetical protein